MQLYAVSSEVWVINWIQDGGCRHLEFIIIATFGHMAYFQQWLAKLLQNFINLTQTPAELLVFVQKSKMAAAAILSYYFVTPDHPRSPFAVLNLLFKFCVDRVYTFRDIAIWKFHKCGLRCLFRPPKSCFWGILTHKLYFLLSRPTKGSSLSRYTHFESLLVVIGPMVWSGREAKCTKKRKNHK